MTNTEKTFFTSNFHTSRNYEFHSPSVQKKKIKIQILVLSQSLLEIYESTLATQKLAAFLHIIQALHQDIF